MLDSRAKIDRYVVMETLGQGAMGTVYKAVDPLIERTVAIKTINLNLSNAERTEFETRFFREAKSAGRLSHANIVTIYDVGETDDIAYIAMEYLKGESLREMLDSGVVLPVALICKIAACVANALDYAHENDVVHRDIKPANIMISPDHAVKIMDFGIAQLPTGSQTQLGTLLGSPKYMAPEQVAGRTADGRTDIFALGVVLYEMLTGTVPFDGDNLIAIMNKIANEAAVPPSSVSARVPKAFDNIVARALAKRPEDRYQRASEFAQALAHLEASSVTPAVASRSLKTSAATVDALATTMRLTNATQLRPVASETSAVATLRRSRPSAAQSIFTKLRHVTLRRVTLVGVPLLVLVSVAVVLQGNPKSKGMVAANPAPSSTIKGATATLSVAQSAGKPNSEATSVKPASASVIPLPADGDAARTNTNTSAAPAVVPATARVASQKSASDAVQAESAKSTISLAVYPWGEVWVDGKNVGVSPPLTELKLAPGRHTIEIRNQTFTPYRETVTLTLDQSKKIRYKFQ
jgi:eukaryotic-like serine/threonine-protein kinase